MITDDERREVAARLREYASWDEDGVLVECAEFGESVLDLLDGETERECFNALADLIEPGEPKVKCVTEVKIDGGQLEKLAHDAAVELTGIDRDALLALADEMDAYTKCDDERCGEMMPPNVIHDYARRIREALGVDDA